MLHIKKTVRANHKPYMTKQLRKAIMRRSYLEHQFYKHKTTYLQHAYKKQKNYCNRLYKRERRKFYSNINLNDITDNKKFWKITKLLFGDKGGCMDNIVLVEDKLVISEDTKVAETFNQYFKSTVNSLNIVENRLLLSETNCELNSVDKAIEKFKNHPSIISINENVCIEDRFSFSIVAVNDIRSQIKRLDKKKNGTFMNIPSKHLKQTTDIICEPLVHIWNNEIVNNKKFPTNLKHADITRIFKKLIIFINHIH